MKYCYIVIRRKSVPQKNKGQNIGTDNSQKEMSAKNNERPFCVSN